MPNANAHDPDNREWTEEDFVKAKRGADMLPAAVLGAFGKGRGRPKADVTKVPVKLRVDPDVLTAYKETGPGWQTRMNDVLRKGMKSASTAKKQIGRP